MAAHEPITDTQREFIMDLLNEREITPELSAYVEANRPQSGGLLNRGEASRLIDALKACPKRGVKVGDVAGFSEVIAQRKVVATRDVPHGTYTVDMGDGSHVTLQFAPASFVRDRETTAVAFLSGADNELSYTGFAFVEKDGRVVVWKRFREGHGRQQAALQLLLTGDVAEAHRRFLDLAEAYALRSGSCMRCGKTLTVPASLHRGLGPVCAARESATAAEVASTPRFEGDAIPPAQPQSTPEIDALLNACRDRAQQLPF